MASDFALPLIAQAQSSVTICGMAGPGDVRVRPPDQPAGLLSIVASDECVGLLTAEGPLALTRAEAHLHRAAHHLVEGVGGQGACWPGGCRYCTSL